MGAWGKALAYWQGRLLAAPAAPTPMVGAACGARRAKDIGVGSQPVAPLTLPVLGGLGGVPPGPNIPPYAPKIPPQPPHAEPRGRPGWWSAALPQSRLLYPDDQANLLFEEMRRTTPILSRALEILTGLVGAIEFSGPKGPVADLDDWARRVKVNQTQRGLGVWLEAHIDGMLAYGKGVTEIIPSGELKDVYALMNLDPRSIVFQVTADPLVLLPLQRQHVNAFLMALNPETILISVNGGHADTPHGWSLFRSLPFTAAAARIVENSTAQVWQRMGCPSFHVNWNPSPGFSDPRGNLAAQSLAALRTQWDAMMTGRDFGAGGTGQNAVADYFTAGPVTVGVMGHDHTPLPLAETWRVFEEQLVAVTGLPSWLLGFHWATTERMALQQAEVLVANIESLRRHMTPQIEQLVDLRQRFAGKAASRIKVGWSRINLHDMTEQARAKCWNAQGRQGEIANAVALWQMGFVSQRQAWDALRMREMAADYADWGPDRPMAAPPPPPAEAEISAPPDVRPQGDPL